MYSLVVSSEAWRNPREPVDGLDRPAVDYDTSVTPGLTRDQAAALLAAADADAGPQAARTAALAATLFTGARVSELHSADIEDLGTGRGHRVLRVRRKGGKIQALALPAPAAARIDAYPGQPRRRDRPTGRPRRHGNLDRSPGYLLAGYISRAR